MEFEPLPRLPQAFAGLFSVIQNDFPLLSKQKHIFLIDSMPIMTAHAQRSNRAKVAREIADKGYNGIQCCLTKNADKGGGSNRLITSLGLTQLVLQLVDFVQLTVYVSKRVTCCND